VEAVVNHLLLWYSNAIELKHGVKGISPRSERVAKGAIEIDE
jgi:hypothetical protein